MKNVRATAVYVMEADTGLIKVGRSFEPSQRLRQIERASGAKLRLVHSTEIREDASLVEAIAHQVLAQKRRSGEWFDVTAPEAIAAIREAIVEIGRRGEYARCKGCAPASRVRVGERPEPSGKNHPVSLRFTPELMGRLKALAAAERRSLASFIRMHVARMLEREEALRVEAKRKP